ncbi:Fic family protein [Acetobacterium sp.]|uniref:Fic family protein n=1 Tax=Acetobacterium sp. TaxID=1872094 RepID=UPI00359447BF
MCTDTNLWFIGRYRRIIPLTMQASDQATMQATMQAVPQATMQTDEEISRLLEYCKIPRTRSEIQKYLKFNNRDHFRKNILNPLIKGGLLKLTIPDKPTSPKQKYFS